MLLSIMLEDNPNIMEFHLGWLKTPIFLTFQSKMRSTDLVNSLISDEEAKIGELTNRLYFLLNIYHTE